MGDRAEAGFNQPLTEARFFIMLSLAAEPKHGYGIMKDVRALSDGRVRLTTGTLYGAIKRLLEQGLIARMDHEQPRPEDIVPTNRPRKAYALTHSGRHTLNAEVSRLQELLSTARLRTSDGVA